MFTDPKKNRTQLDSILLEQFRRKGYRCEEIEEDDTTTFIITYEKTTCEVLTHVINDMYKDFVRAN